MTGKEYADIIDGFDVENNSKYLPSGGYTYCNIFAQDVADACDTPLPTGGCENMWNSLAHNQFPKWWSVTRHRVVPTMAFPLSVSPRIML